MYEQKKKSDYNFHPSQNGPSKIIYLSAITPTMYKRFVPSMPNAIQGCSKCVLLFNWSNLLKSLCKATLFNSSSSGLPN